MGIWKDVWATLRRCKRGEYLPECVALGLALFVVIYTLTTGI